VWVMHDGRNMLVMHCTQHSHWPPPGSTPSKHTHRATGVAGCAACISSADGCWVCSVCSHLKRMRLLTPSAPPPLICTPPSFIKACLHLPTHPNHPPPHPPFAVCHHGQGAHPGRVGASGGSCWLLSHLHHPLGGVRPVRHCTAQGLRAPGRRALGRLCWHEMAVHIACLQPNSWQQCGLEMRHHAKHVEGGWVHAMPM
jgi:hypothetical protein